VDAFDPITKNNVTVAGNPDAAATMIFVHGFGTDQSSWREVAAAFARDYRLVLFDNTGAGRSRPEAFVQHRYLNLRAYAEDLLDICAALQFKDAVLVGHSVGAMIGLLAAIRRPQHFSRLVLIGASPRYLDDEGYHGGFTKSDIDELYSTMTHSYSTWAKNFAPLVMGNPDSPHLAQQFAETIKTIPPNHALTVLCSIFQSDHRGDLDKLTLPTLLIQAREDIAVPLAVAEYLNRHIAGSRLAVIEATGHLPHISAPAAVIKAMRGFL
jgi:sigma-B regulation protein RsbQ